MRIQARHSSWLLGLILAACQHGSPGVADEAQPSTVQPGARPTPCATGRLEVKFRDGSGVRLRDGRLRQLPELGQADVPGEAVVAALDVLNGPRVRRVERMFQEPEAELDRKRATGQAGNAGQKLPDLNLWFVAELAAPDAGAALLAELAGSKAIDSAQCAPEPQPLPQTLPPPPNP